MKSFVIVAISCWLGVASTTIFADDLMLRVEQEDDVYTYVNADNGAGPLWCSGSTSIVRSGGRVFVAGLETIPDAKRLNNCRWMLFTRDADRWQQVRVDPTGRTREPSPLAASADGRVFLSVNPTLDPTAYSGPALPDVLRFDAEDPTSEPTSLTPKWQGTPAFSEHSYRSFAADGEAGELVLLQNIGYTHAEWTFRDSSGKWSAQGQLKWPWGDQYQKPQPIRVCYPNVAMRDRAVHFFGVSDIVEPNPGFRKFKRDLTGQEWDYDFRRLFYTWTSDITEEPFHEWIEIASREATCGRVAPCDLWLAPGGEVHLLWTERAIDTRLREKFFPDAKQSETLNHAVIHDGKVTHRQSIQRKDEGKPGLVGYAARFHVTPDHRLFVVHQASGTDQDGTQVSENRIVEMLPDGTVGPATRIPLDRPFTNFFTTTVRAGSPESWAIELLGPRQGTPMTMSYARIRLMDPPSE
ncbi:hypothetical protein K227x_39110 [Rubripirellula lacrimiformis]|uniref:Uncharacterized protein n=1 Tax=Rubripirellula lacrimiformis TaxID=1930273 RepID=A0A517NEF8_9BACT|nr:hypothetical protein [Rubripirellula lacrimiformis]QDT05511.1 hypothetical protein K227x_39110 [Rubripirellula lacrimiformis]